MPDDAEKKEEEQEEPEVEVVDRRSASVAADDEAPEEAPEPAAEEDAAADAGDAEAPPSEDDERLMEAMFPDSVYDILSSFMLMLSEIAWRKIGLRANPRTNKVEKDLMEAQVAIDTLEVVVEKLVPKAPPEQARDMQNLVVNLKLNFARQSKPQPEPESN